MKRNSALAALVILSACGKSSSPTFPPGTVLEITGRFLAPNQDPLLDTRIHFRNLRQFGYVDNLALGIATWQSMFLLPMAFPFFAFYEAPLPDPEDYTERPNYFLTSMRTNSDGRFTFRIRADRMLRDADDAINIVLVNDDDNEMHAFAKAAFVVKEEKTDLGNISTCDLGGISKSESGGNFTLTWTAPSWTVARYVVNVATQDDNSLVWAKQVTGATTVTLPKATVGAQAVRVAIEAFAKDEDSTKISCLTPPLDFTLDAPVTTRIEPAQVSTPDIPFRLSSLTNQKFSDKDYLGAFDTGFLIFDFGSEQTLTTMLLHNLRVGTTGNVAFSTATSADGPWTLAGQIPAARFLHHTFATPITTRYLKLSFPASLQDLKEVTFQ